MTHAHRILLKAARIVHVYLTMFGFTLILFFAVTGFMLNHEEWFLPDADDIHTSTTTGVMPTRLLNPMDKLAVVELLRKDFGVTGYLVGFDETEARVTLRGPGREDVARIQLDDGATEVTHEYRGLLSLVADLHKSKAGGAWQLLVDAVCFLLVLVCATGLILWQSLRGPARHGLAVLALGFLLSVGIFYCSCREASARRGHTSPTLPWRTSHLPPQARGGLCRFVTLAVEGLRLFDLRTASRQATVLCVQYHKGTSPHGPEAADGAYSAALHVGHHQDRRGRSDRTTGERRQGTAGELG